ncbi:hypothetical protein BDV95DRAFT_607696 [Massariosphaeria phaeospora]|uniref:F-box domain-containing protein n=1 Tax=Massariosphaeria phaeospora TaxID=100035 RepID=A0A7C8I825_9PLEO|nr:hypothetical protein BDV95DRAFT_607696 [Massariosphaeria phaeospora]
MVRLNELAEELRLEIAYHVSDPVDLCNLALAFQAMRIPAQETLHRHASVSGNDLAKPRIMFLARTLLDRPDLGEKILSLDMLVSESKHGHHQDCITGCCFCYFGQLSAAAKSLVRKSTVTNEKWTSLLGQGSEPAYVGLLLMLTPNLGSLKLEAICSLRSRWDRLPVRPNISAYFGVEMEHFLPGDIPGLAKLKSISAPGTLAWTWMSSPNLKKATLGTYSLNHSSLERELLRSDDWHFSPHLARLTVCCDLEDFQRRNSRTLRRWLRSLVSGIETLRHVIIHIDVTRCYSATADDWARGCYDNLIGLAMPIGPTLESVIIENRMAANHDLLGYFNSVPRLLSFEFFPYLQRFVAPLNAYMSVEEAANGRVTSAAFPAPPATIQTLEVMNPGGAHEHIEQWGVFVSFGRSVGRWPKLQTVVLHQLPAGALDRPIWRSFGRLGVEVKAGRRMEDTEPIE